MPIYHVAESRQVRPDLDQDYHRAPGAEEAEKKFPGV